MVNDKIKIIVGLAQYDIAWEDKEANMARCKDFVNAAAQKKVDLLLFPEMCLTGFSMNIAKIADVKKTDHAFFARLAKDSGLSIGFGTVVSEGSKGRNLYCVVSPYSGLVAEYNKIHSFSPGNEDLHYKSGEKLSILDISGVSYSPFICYDLRFPEVFQAVSARAIFISVAANWPEKRREHWITLLKARAIENQCFVAGINRIGEGNGIRYSGDSMLIGPSGDVIEKLGNEEKLLVGEVCCLNAMEVRRGFSLKNDRKNNLYVSLLQDEYLNHNEA